MQQNYTYRQDLRLTVHQRTTLPMKIKQNGCPFKYSPQSIWLRTPVKEKPTQQLDDLAQVIIADFQLQEWHAQEQKAGLDFGGTDVSVN
jgi:seryl-tRNA(Sec) selenium transferase